MSRSCRKTPIFGHTAARSEADDKRLWHKRWRSRERNQLAVLKPDSDPVPVHRHAVSSTWDMAKDGKSWLFYALNPSNNSCCLSQFVGNRLFFRQIRLKFFA